MNTDKLIDAIGAADNDIIESVKRTERPSRKRKRGLIAAAAVLFILILRTNPRQHRTKHAH